MLVILLFTVYYLFINLAFVDIAATFFISNSALSMDLATADLSTNS